MSIPTQFYVGPEPARQSYESVYDFATTLRRYRFAVRVALSHRIRYTLNVAQVDGATFRVSAGIPASRYGDGLWMRLLDAARVSAAVRQNVETQLSLLEA